MNLAAAARLWHTVRHLRAQQIYGRVWFRLSRPRIDTRPAPPLRSAAAAWIACARTPSLTGPATLCFLGSEHALSTAADWNRADWPRLWVYNAHYFDDLAAARASERSAWQRALIARWIAENPPAAGAGWDSYPISLRVVNWLKWQLAGESLDAAARDSLAVQLRHLSHRLEFHLLGNHLWANAKALVFAGACFDGDEARGWRERGLRLLRRELAEQVLPDGGHFERSPMYHAIVLEDLLDLLQLATRTFPGTFDGADVGAWHAAATRMLRWLAAMSHPDGEIALFNDAAFGIAPPYAALAQYAAAIGIAVPAAAPAPIVALAESGYVRLAAGEALLIADVAPVGPDYQPGHAHADTLSFEFSLRGRRVLVNGGTSTYEPGPERQRQRGTPMHNTVAIDGCDSSEVWHGFRVARRAHPFDVRSGVDADTVWLEGAHDGYRRLPGRAIHRRRWELTTQGLRVCDTLEGRWREAVAYFRFHPDCALQADAADGGTVTGGGIDLRWRVNGAAKTEIADGTWHPRFGASLPCRVLRIAFAGAALDTRFEWS